MIIETAAKSGTLESNDIQILIMPSASNSLEIEIESTVMMQFGRQIKETILKTLEKNSIQSAKVKAYDKGALDFVIRSRVEVAIERAMGGKSV